MIGAIAGDIIGSIYEHAPIKTKNFPLFDPACRFTDDTVLTIAIAEAILTDGNYLRAVKEMGRKYPNAGYGGSFIQWLQSSSQEPYNSWGNGSAMRVSPVGYAFDSIDSVLNEAAATANITHNHQEGVKGAQATALSIFLARTAQDKVLIKKEVEDRFGYDLDRSLDKIRETYQFDVSCQGTVPESIIAFLESDSYEDAVRNAVSLGGDSDTLACITGGIAEAFYGPVGAHIQVYVQESLTDDLWNIVSEFDKKYIFVDDDPGE